MQAFFHPDVVALDWPVMQKALRKRGIALDFGAAWKAFKEALVEGIEGRKPAFRETGSEDGDSFFRLIVPFSDLRMSAYLQVKEGRILVWVLEVGGRMDVPHHLGRRRNVTEKGVTFTYPPGKAGAA